MTHGTNDEYFARELRAHIDAVGPEIAVDLDAVVPRARRRRARQVVAAGVASVGVVALVATWAASAEPWAGPAEVRPAGPSMTDGGRGASDDPATAPAAQAVLDRANGTITTPIDAWSWDSREYAISRTAVEHYVVQCLRDAGYEATFGGPAPLDPGRDDGYGLWREADVESGYAGVLAPTEDDVDGTGARWDTDVVPAEESRRCHLEALGAGLAFDVGDFQDGPVGITSAVDTDEGRAIREEWRQCLQRNGASAPKENDAGWIPDGVVGAPLEEQRRVAAIDVGCKDELGTVQRIADLQAQEDAAYVRRGAEYLERRHAAEEKALAAARAYLDEAEVEMPWEDGS